jgi:hypothetical protein
MCGPFRIKGAYVGLYVLLSLLGNGSVNIFRRKQRIIGGVVFCVVRVVSKDSRRLILPRTYCLNYFKYSINMYFKFLLLLIRPLTDLHTYRY